jgi:hypothetical protein
MSSDAQGCISALVIILFATLAGGCWKQRQDARAILQMQTLINEVHTGLKKGKVRQVIELLDERQREIDFQAAWEESR